MPGVPPDALSLLEHSVKDVGRDLLASAVHRRRHATPTATPTPTASSGQPTPVRHRRATSRTYGTDDTPPSPPSPSSPPPPPPAPAPPPPRSRPPPLDGTDARLLRHKNGLPPTPPSLTVDRGQDDVVDGIADGAVQVTRTMTMPSHTGAEPLFADGLRNVLETKPSGLSTPTPSMRHHHSPPTPEASPPSTAVSRDRLRTGVVVALDSSRPSTAQAHAQDALDRQSATYSPTSYTDSFRTAQEGRSATPTPIIAPAPDEPKADWEHFVSFISSQQSSAEPTPPQTRDGQDSARTRASWTATPPELRRRSAGSAVMTQMEEIADRLVREHERRSAQAAVEEAAFARRDDDPPRSHPRGHGLGIHRTASDGARRPETPPHVREIAKEARAAGRVSSIKKHGDWKATANTAAVRSSKDVAREATQAKRHSSMRADGTLETWQARRTEEPEVEKKGKTWKRVSSEGQAVTAASPTTDPQMTPRIGVERRDTEVTEFSEDGHEASVRDGREVASKSGTAFTVQSADPIDYEGDGSTTPRLDGADHGLAAAARIPGAYPANGEETQAVGGAPDMDHTATSLSTPSARYQPISESPPTIEDTIIAPGQPLTSEESLVQFVSAREDVDDSARSQLLQDDPLGRHASSTSRDETFHHGQNSLPRPNHIETAELAAEPAPSARDVHAKRRVSPTLSAKPDQASLRALASEQAQLDGRNPAHSSDESQSDATVDSTINNDALFKHIQAENIRRMSALADASAIQASIVETRPLRQHTLRRSRKVSALREDSDSGSNKDIGSAAQEHSLRHKNHMEPTRVSSIHTTPPSANVARKLHESPALSSPKRERPRSEPVRPATSAMSKMATLTGSGFDEKHQLSVAKVRQTPFHEPRRHKLKRTLRDGTLDKHPASKQSGPSSEPSSPTARQLRRFSREERLENNTSVRRTSTASDHIRHTTLDASQLLAPSAAFGSSPRRAEAVRASILTSSTPFSVTSDRSDMEVCEAKGVSIFPHNNNSLLVVQQGGRSANVREEGKAKESLEYFSVKPVGRRSLNLQEGGKANGSPEHFSVKPAGATDRRPSVTNHLRVLTPDLVGKPAFDSPVDVVTPTLGTSSQRNAVDSPLRNPRKAPQPPVIKVLPATPNDELDKQLSALNNQDGVSASASPPTVPLRRETLRAKARRYSETFVVHPLFGRQVSLGRRKRGARRTLEPDEENSNNLHPFWRPRYFWEDADSDSEDSYDDEDYAVLPRGGDTSEHPETSRRSRTLSLLPRAPSIRKTRRASLPAVLRHGGKHHAGGVGQIQRRNTVIAIWKTRHGRVVTLPGGSQLEYVGLMPLRERMGSIRQAKEEREAEKRRERLRDQIGYRVYHGS